MLILISILYIKNTNKDDHFYISNTNGYVDVSSFSRGSQCILGSLGANKVASVLQCYRYSHISRIRAKFSSKSH